MKRLLLCICALALLGGCKKKQAVHTIGLTLDVGGRVFRDNEGSLLAGALAGELTKTGKMGCAGGMQLPLIRKFEAGFRAGVRQVNARADVLIAYTGTFDDEKKGVEVGQDMYGRA